SSSVINGIIGCANLNTVSSTRTNVRRVARCCTSFPLYSCTLASSTYQSQYSSQINSYISRAAKSNRYSLKASAIVHSACCKRPTIHLSICEKSNGNVSSSPVSFPSQFISTKRVAFHNLLQKLR